MIRNLTLGAIAATCLITLAAEPGLARGPHGPAFDFDAVDLNGDGAITPEEIEARRKARFAKADTNGDGGLDRAELIASITASIDERRARRDEKRTERRAERMAERMLRRADSNDDGRISADERPVRDSSRLFRRADLNEDGKITRDEADKLKARMRDKR